MVKMNLIAKLIGVCAISLSFHAFASEADLLWVEVGVPNQIMRSKLDNYQWSEPEVIYSSKNSLTSIGVVKDLEENEFLVWTEQLKTRSVIMKMQRGNRQNSWSPAKLFIDFGKENLASTMVVDRTNQIWLFFSSNQGDLDDVYLSIRSKSGWSTPTKVNSKNKVPDIQPHAKLTKDGDVYVSWRSYDFGTGDYLTQDVVFELDKSLKSSYKTDPVVPELSFNDLVLPSYIPSTYTGLVYFPKNRIQQSVIITPLFQ